ncbi:glycosyltransferase [Alteriqipengyuania sp. 357]
MESHCHQLVGALERRGHEVTLFAAPGSDAGQLYPICEVPYETCLPWRDWHGTDRLQMFQDDAFGRAQRAIERGSFDIVHNNSLSPAMIEWGLASGHPIVTSHHVPPFATMSAAVSSGRNSRSSHFTVTSNHQLQLWSGRAGDNMHVVPNGIALEDWHEAPARSEYLLWFGRVTPTKGLRETVAAARIAGVSLKIVGAIEDRPYFEDHVEPFLDYRITYEGHLGGSALAAMVAQARAAVVTPMWDEPFGLVAAEAMAAGVPVIAFDRGAMREVLGRCGRLVAAGDVAALAQAMATADQLDGAPCRERVRTHFSVGRMIKRYEAIYALAIAGAEAASGPPPACGEAALASSQSSTVELLA